MRVQGAAFRVLAVFSLSVLVSAHVGSPDVFYSGKAGLIDVSVIVRPPEVVPGIARVIVRTPARIRRVTIRPVFWRAGARGAPTADVMRLVSSTQTTGFRKVEDGHPTNTFEGSLWLMARGAYSVDVQVTSGYDSGSVTVPVASVATGRLALDTPLAAVLTVLGLFLLTGLINIVRKASGESLLEPGKSLGDAGVRTTRIAGVAAVVLLSLATFGGARWWGAVDDDYQRTIYKPAPLSLSLANGVLRLAASDTQYFAGGRVSSYVPDHGKLMHLFLVREGDARAFAHLHPRADSSPVPAFTTTLPPLPAGKYFVYGDVVQETGFERTLRGELQVADETASKRGLSDTDDGWYTGDASTNSSRLADGSVMTLTSGTDVKAGEEVALGVSLTDESGRQAPVQPYLGMVAHAVVVRMDGEVYVHLHPMGTVTAAAQEVFGARNRGDTTATGALRLSQHAAMPGMESQTWVSATTSFPYAFPKPGDYRVFVQVKRSGRVLTGAFAIKVGDAPAATK